jgi:hypothetical protein
MIALLALLAFGPMAQAQGGFDSSTRAAVNLRQGPGTNYGIIELLYAGEPIHVAGRSDDTGLWLYVSAPDGATGWVSSLYTNAAPDIIASMPIIAVSVEAPVLQAPPPVNNAAPAPAASGPVSYGAVYRITGTSRAIFQHGQQLGNRANVFSKVGDSITADPRFLAPIAWNAYNLRDYGNLQDVITYFSAAGVRTANSFANDSLAARGGWTTANVLDPGSATGGICQGGETPLACEYRVDMPALAIIMLGTNDMAALPLNVFRSNLATIAQISIDRGVIPVFSTIPTRCGFEGAVPGFNQAIIDTSNQFDVPLIDYAGVMGGLPGGGISGHCIHPSAAPGNSQEDYGASADFTGFNLQFGYTQRNLTALEALDAVWRDAMN